MSFHSNCDIIYCCVTQTYLQLATTRSEERRLKMKQKEPQIDAWISRNNLDKEKKTIMEKVQHSLEVDKDINVETLVNALPHEYRRYITRELSRGTLKKVSPLQNHLSLKIFYSTS